MKAKEIRELSHEELERKLTEATRELFDARLEAATGQLGHTHKVQALRRDLARLKTISHGRRLKIASEVRPDAAPEANGD